MATKEDLDLAKLELEVADLKRPWWQRPAYLAILLPIVLSILTFLSALLSGFFDQQRARLKAENERLAAAISANQTALERINASVRRSLQQLADTKKFEEEETQKLNVLQKQLDTEIVGLQQQVQELQSTIRQKQRQ